MNLDNSAGSAMLECALICALIALSAIASIGTTGVLVSNQFKKSGDSLKLAKQSSHELGSGSSKNGQNEKRK